MSNFRDLIVWNKSMDFAVEVYKVIDKLPKHENYALSDQLRRAVVSISSNIAEGQKRASVKEVVHFSSIALGSLAEVETQLELVNRLYGIDVSDQLGRATEIGKMLSSLTRTLRAK